MAIIFDIAIILIFLINIYICYEKGLVKLAIGLVAVLVSIALAMVFYKPISSLIIKNTQIDENIKNAIIENFTTESEENTEENDNVLKYIEKYVDNAVNKTRNEIVTEAAGTISIKIINVGAMIGIFIIARIALLVITLVANLITDLPILKQFNEVGGILYGLVKALLIVYIILAIIFFIVFITGNATISDAIAHSYITKFFYNNNLLLNIFF